jgi:hypothetical protein
MAIPNFDGTNDLPAATLFYRRLSFRAYVLNCTPGYAPVNLFKPTIETLQVKDFELMEKSMRGKISISDFPIIPKSEKIKNTKLKGSTGVYALNFVADAFDALAVRFEDALRSGQILDNKVARNPSNDLVQLRAQKGYVDPLAEYSDFRIRARNTFVLDYIGLGDKKKIRNIYDFSKFYEDYLLSQRNTSYFLSDYIRSALNSQLNTGLAIEISKASYSEDKYKVDNFYKADNFAFYKAAAYAYGFNIDKNIPWRLVADISSPQMIEYIAKAGASITSNTFTILDNYDLVDFSDFIVMLEDYIQAYNLFVSRNPRTKTFVDVGCKYEMPEFIIRSPTNIEGLNELTTAYWLEKYVDLKNRYSTLNLGIPEINQMKKTVRSLAGTTDLLLIVNYINNKFISNNHFEGSINHTLTKLSFRDQGINESVSDAIKKDTASKIFKIY